MFSLVNTFFNKSIVEASKAVFNDYISYCKDGKVLLFASQKGENTLNANSGGIFFANILKSAKYLLDKSTNPIVTNTPSVLCLICKID